MNLDDLLLAGYTETEAKRMLQILNDLPEDDEEVEKRFTIVFK